jgi:hypothetical protein
VTRHSGINMNVFVSWSGNRSKIIATALKWWLPDMFQGLHVWMSNQDILAGSRWDRELVGELETSNFGVICLTPESLKSHWLTFEAGALSKVLKDSRVIPYRFQLRESDVSPPLSQFQGVDADEEGTLKLVLSINDALDKSLQDEARTKRAFEHWWPDLQKKLTEIPSTPPVEIRSDRDLLEEILEIVRKSGIRDLNNLLLRILLLPNVQRVEMAPKHVAGEDTHRLALRITVAKKLPPEQIPPDQLIPPSIFGLPTDVVEAAQ